jgi:hypothetical protein
MSRIDQDHVLALMRYRHTTQPIRRPAAEGKNVRAYTLLRLVRDSIPLVAPIRVPATSVVTLVGIRPVAFPLLVSRVRAQRSARSGLEASNWTIAGDEMHVGMRRRR